MDEISSLNYSLPDVFCAIGNSQLAKIEKFNSRRQLIFDQIVYAFVDLHHAIVPIRKEFVELMWHLFPITVRAEIRRQVFVMLRNAGFGVKVNSLSAYGYPDFKKDADF